MRAQTVLLMPLVAALLGSSEVSGPIWLVYFTLALFQTLQAFYLELEQPFTVKS